MSTRQKNLFFLLAVVFAVSLILPFSVYAKKKNKMKIYSKAKAFLLKGDVQIQKANSKKWKPLKMNSVITKKDKVKIGKASYLKLKFKDKSVLVVRGEKIFVLQDLMQKMLLKRDKAALLKKLKGGTRKPVGATAVAGVRGNKVGDVLDKSDKIYWEK